jgi:hypothetical protein
MREMASALQLAEPPSVDDIVDDIVRSPEALAEAARRAREVARRFPPYLAEAETGFKAIMEGADSLNIDFESVIGKVKKYEWNRLFEAQVMLHFVTFLTNNPPPAHHSEAAVLRGCLQELSQLLERAHEDSVRCRKYLEAKRDEGLARYESVWQGFLESLDARVGPGLAKDVRVVWGSLGSFLWPPDAAPTEDGVLLVWDRGRHHLQVEVFKNGLFDWFHRDRDAGDTEGDENVPVGLIPDGLKQVVQKLARN